MTIQNLNTWFRPSKIACIEIISGTTQTLFHLAVIQKKGEDFESILQQSDISNFDEIVALCKKHCTTIFLSFSLADVLYRKDASSGNLDQRIQSLIPGIQPNDYFIQENKMDDFNWLCFCRKEKIQKWIDKFQLQHFNLHGFQVGPFPILQTLAFVNHEQSLSSSSFQLELDQKKNIIEITKGDFHKTNLSEIATDQLISTNQLLLMACGIASLSNSDFGLKHTLVNRGQNQSIAQQKIKKLLLPLLGFI